MRRGQGSFYSGGEQRDHENGFRSQPPSSHHCGTSEFSVRHSMSGDGMNPPGLSQTVDNRLRELRMLPSDRGGRDCKNQSEYGCGPPQQSYEHGQEDYDGLQAAGRGQYLGPQAPSGHVGSFPFPSPPPFHPSQPPPDFPQFPGHPGPMFSIPPPPFKQGAGSVQMYSNTHSVLLKATHGIPPPPPSPSGVGMTRGPPAIIGKPPAPQNNFGIGGTSYGPCAPPTQNYFLTPPPPLPSHFSSSLTPGRSSDTYHVGQSGFSGAPPKSAPSAVLPGESDIGSGITDGQREVNMWLQKRGKWVHGSNAANRDTHSLGRTVGKAEPTAPPTGIASGKVKSAGAATLGEAQNSLSSLLHALAAVQGELRQLQEQQRTADTETWEASIAKLRQLKDTYLQTKQKLDKEQLKTLKRKMVLRRRKRERQKRNRQEAKEVEQQVQFERAQKHAAIDQWLEKLRQEYLTQQQMKKMKELADKTLSKVRKDIREARKMVDTVKRLQKLREIRNDTAQKRGETFQPSVAEHFMEKTRDLMELLTQQIDAFEKEEAALKLILETENEEAKEKEKKQKREKAREEQRREREEESLSLFGPQTVPEPGDSLQPFTEFYMQAQCSMHALLNIRREWDSFLVPHTTPLASRVPDSWVRAEPPSSAVWASVLQHKVS